MIWENWCPHTVSARLRLWVRSGCPSVLISGFYSRYRHFRDRKHQQNKGYQSPESQVNRNDLYYGMYYGSRAGPSRTWALITFE